MDRFSVYSLFAQYRLSDRHLNLKFNERLTEMPENEAYYLLTAFANMAISRRCESQNLINTICKEVFEVILYF